METFEDVGLLDVRLTPLNRRSGLDLHSVSYALRRCDSKAPIDLPSHRNVDTHSVAGNDASPLVDSSHSPSTRVIRHHDDIHTAVLGLRASTRAPIIS